jgi:hypothetical protein
MPTLSNEQQRVLRSMLHGSQLKSHRSMDGAKVYHLHAIEDGAARTVTATTVEQLRNLGLISSNMKFPAAVYLLTHSGATVAYKLDKPAGVTTIPVTAPDPSPAAPAKPADSPARSADPAEMAADAANNRQTTRSTRSSKQG